MKQSVLIRRPGAAVGGGWQREAEEGKGRRVPVLRQTDGRLCHWVGSLGSGRRRYGAGAEARWALCSLAVMGGLPSCGCRTPVLPGPLCLQESSWLRHWPGSRGQEHPREDAGSVCGPQVTPHSPQGLSQPSSGPWTDSSMSPGRTSLWKAWSPRTAWWPGWTLP